MAGGPEGCVVWGGGSEDWMAGAAREGAWGTSWRQGDLDGAWRARRLDGLGSVSEAKPGGWKTGTAIVRPGHAAGRLGRRK
eukprot:365974-Chlamydomonas_euryale.AAC.2